MQAREISFAAIQYRDGTTSILSGFFSDDESAFFDLMDEMQNMCRMDENIAGFGFDILTTTGNLQKACQKEENNV